ALDIDAEGEDPDLAVPALEEGARDGTFVALEEEEPAAPPRVAEGVRGDLGEELAVAPAGVRHVEPAPEGFALRRVRRHADRQTEPAGAADVVLPRRPTGRVADDHLLERPARVEPQRDGARDAHRAPLEDGERPGRLPEREVRRPREAVGGGGDAERAHRAERPLGRRLGEEGAAPVGRREVVGREQARERRTLPPHPPLETADGESNPAEAPDPTEDLRRRAEPRACARRQERRALVDEVEGPEAAA